MKNKCRKLIFRLFSSSRVDLFVKKAELPEPFTDSKCVSFKSCLFYFSFFVLSPVLGNKRYKLKRSIGHVHEIRWPDEGQLSRNKGLCTLGARGFSCAVSGFGLRPTKRSSPSQARKNLCYPG